jgi:UDP-N-acetylglucosamine 1-carboxyvinyltransferase
LQGVDYEIIPDRIEVGTFIIASAITGGEVVIDKIIPGHVEALIRKLNEAGVVMQVNERSLVVKEDGRPKAVDVKTLPYPGFPTDLQAQFTSLLAVSSGTSIVTETIFENRFMHVPELRRMGAEIKIEGNSIIISGVKELSGAPVRVSDLRAGAALVLAGLVAKGETTLDDMDRHLVRGYENLIDKFAGLGGDLFVPKTVPFEPY